MALSLATSTLEDYWFGEGAADDADHAAAESVAALVARVHGVKPLPVAANKLARVAKDPETPVATIAKILESDPGLLSRVLRLVNSAAFALRVPCKSAKNAVTLLGPKRIAELAMASAVLDLFDDASGQSRSILEHALAVAAIMKRLAQKCEMNVEDAFTCGLLHDIGKLMQLQVGDDGYAALLAADGDGHAIHLRERELFGFDHGVLAGHMLRTWNVPSPVPEAIGLHHHLARAYDAGGNVADMVHMLRVAELLGDAAVAERPDDEVLDALVKDESVSFVELTKDDLVSLWSDLHAAVVSSKRQLAGGSDEEAAPVGDDSGVHVRKPTRIGIDPFGDDGPRLPRYKRSSVARTVAVCVGIAAAVAALVSVIR
jgi:putative nucleotidyltransferase with HDIG domain